LLSEGISRGLRQEKKQIVGDELNWLREEGDAEMKELKIGPPDLGAGRGWGPRVNVTGRESREGDEGRHVRLKGEGDKTIYPVPKRGRSKRNIKWSKKV